MNVGEEKQLLVDKTEFKGITQQTAVISSVIQPQDYNDKHMIVLIKTLTKLLTYALIFVLFLCRWSDILFYSAICHGCCPVHREFEIPDILLRYHKLSLRCRPGEKVLGLKGYFVRPYLKWPK